MIDMQIGTKLVLEPKGNAARDNRGTITGTITKIGRDYFYVSIFGDENAPDNWPLKFNKTTLRYHNPQDGNSSYQIYESMDDYEKHLELVKMVTALRQYFMDFSTQHDYGTIKKVYETMVAGGAITE
ncbi:MAG: hypothetical protein HDQ88_08730 [Clostridia bacterium]|nr:hypothetical protein [Clostridia bacterium]